MCDEVAAAILLMNELPMHKEIWTLPLFNLTVEPIITIDPCMGIVVDMV